MVIQNVRIFTQDKKFCPGSIEVRDGRIAAVRYGTAVKDGCVETYDDGMETVVDGGGCYALPGMIDMHFHGCKGWDICDLPEGDPDEEQKKVFGMWQEIADYQESVGVTGIAPATMTLPKERLRKTLQYAADFAQLQESGVMQGSRLLGINMEGPFISPVRCGAQNASHILPCSGEILNEFLAAGRGLVKVMGIAPEKAGALAMIGRMKDRVRFSLAHTDADYGMARQALEAGACHVTHLFNGMPPWHHRSPGTAGAALDAAAEGREFTAELICDGFHLHPSVVRTAFRLLGEERVVLVSDSMRAAGMPEGEYTLGGQEVVVRSQRERGRTAVLKKNGSLAGSAVSLPDCVRIAVREAGIPLGQAVAAATVNPARCLGMEKEHGSVGAGRWADILLWDRDLVRKMVICRGKILSFS